jgi:hypothetical protein
MFIELFSFSRSTFFDKQISPSVYFDNDGEPYALQLSAIICTGREQYCRGVAEVNAVRRKLKGGCDKNDEKKSEPSSLTKWYDPGSIAISPW